MFNAIKEEFKELIKFREYISEKAYRLESIKPHSKEESEGLLGHIIGYRSIIGEIDAYIEIGADEEREFSQDIEDELIT